MTFLSLKINNFSVGLPANCLTYSLVYLKNNGFLISSFVKSKGFKKLVFSKYFIFSNLFNFFLPADSFVSDLNKNNSLVAGCSFNFFYNSKKLRFFYNNFYNSFISGSKIWFEELELVGLGYRLTLRNRSVRFRLGFSHVIILPIPFSVFLIKRKKRLLAYSTNKEHLSFFISVLLKLKKMSSYKVKGIKKKNQVFILKPGKKRAK